MVHGQRMEREKSERALRNTSMEKEDTSRRVVATIELEKEPDPYAHAIELIDRYFGRWHEEHPPEEYL